MRVFSSLATNNPSLSTLNKRRLPVGEDQGTAVHMAKASSNHGTGTHGAFPRGLLSTSTSRLAQGSFGRMFRALPAAQFGSSDSDTENHLKELARRMSTAPDPPKDDPDDEESGIPALYTYFGQFIDHDITFDPASSLQKQNDPNALIDFRTPALDLDNLYGRGPDDQPYLYTEPPDHKGAKRFLLGNAVFGGTTDAWDLPRNNADPQRALIGDPRNDENAIVSQLHGLFLRFHNRIAHDDHSLTFEEVQQSVRFHYQYVVVNDFLKKIVSKKVLENLKVNGHYDRDKLKFFRWQNDPFMPVEFSVAAYRLGHSMVRPGYRLNDDILLPIFPTSGSDEALFGFREMHKNWGIDWARFIDTETRNYDGDEADKKRRLQFAYKIDTALAHPLHNLATVVADFPHSLAHRNLLRGWRLGLPSGQAVARAMGIEEPDRLTEAEIQVRLPGVTGVREPIAEVNKVFKENCPLWVYILAEAVKNHESELIDVTETDKHLDTPKLGPVGGRIVAEVILGLMFGDPNSLLRLDPLWRPKEPQKLPGKADFALKDFVKYALG
jgi:Animal haem peroxidase